MALQRLFAPLVLRAERRLPALTRMKPAEALPITLHRRRIYIVPSAYGIAFAILLLVMLLGSLNYGNNAALLLTCLLAAVSANSMLVTFRTLDRLSLDAIHAGTARAGERLELRLVFQGNGREHPALQLECSGHEAGFAVGATLPTEVVVPIATHRRGWISMPRLRVLSRYPFGWFRAWSWLAPGARMLVYPRMEAAGPPPPGADPLDGRRRPQGDEWAGLRDYRHGDPRRHIAWKASAHAESLRVKQFDQPDSTAPWRLDWFDSGLAAHEARIARLARWVHEAHAGGHVWSLHLPGASHGPARGTAHFHACMRALAELP
ncbi:MAG TPA: DUF58 domain-containing protein [Rhodanobacteraceae bacterium]|nr:DUF58 domain-containing protein [Rhodanobacteraceae bacterium]